jgi:hypothetical protein
MLKYKIEEKKNKKDLIKREKKLEHGIFKRKKSLAKQVNLEHLDLTPYLA